MSKGLKFENGDIVRNFTNTGYETVEGNAKIRQDVKMILSTNPRKSTGIGAGLSATIGTDNENPASPYLQFPVAVAFQRKVRDGLNNLKKAQRLYQFKQRPDTELIDSFSTVQVIPHSDNPMNFDWRVEVYTVDYVASFPITGAVLNRSENA
jgi:hypothetical protein